MLSCGASIVRDAHRGAGRESTRVRRALVVEDDTQCRESLVAVLGLWGFEAMGVGCGVEALALTSNGRRPEIALCDLGLPDMDGEDIARLLRAGPAITLIAISGQIERLAQLKRGLFDRALAKPFPLHALRECVMGVRRWPSGGSATSSD